MNLVNNERMTKIISVVLSVVFGVLFVSLVANAVTTISTAITTAGGISTTDGALSLTTTNSAPSTITVGCILTYPTSTDTQVHLEFHASGTATVAFATSSNSSNGLAAGLVIWKYGACPTAPF